MKTKRQIIKKIDDLKRDRSYNKDLLRSDEELTNIEIDEIEIQIWFLNKQIELLE